MQRPLRAALSTFFGSARLQSSLPIALLLLIAMPVSAAQAVNSLLLSDAQIDSIHDLSQTKRLLKQYADYIRSTPSEGNVQRIADAMSMHQQRMAGLQQQLIVVALAKLVASNARTQAEAQAEQNKASSDCHDLANVQTALTGGLALNPAPYGRTYLGIAGLISPFFFPKCASGHPITPTNAKEVLKALDDLSTQLNVQIRDEAAFRAQ